MERRAATAAAAGEEALQGVRQRVEALQTELQHKLAADVSAVAHDVKQARADAEAATAAVRQELSLVEGDLARQVGGLRADAEANRSVEAAELAMLKDAVGALKKETSDSIAARVNDVQVRDFTAADSCCTKQH